MSKNGVFLFQLSVILPRYNLIVTFLTAGTVTSPNHPDKYPNNLRKTDTIVVQEGWVIQLEFTAFQLVYYPPCMDYVRIIDGDGTTLLETSCGTGSVVTGGIVHNYSLPPSITSSSNTVDIFLYTAKHIRRSGFSISWQCRTRTGGECTGTPGRLVDI